jgi:hypothetical protein
MGMLAIRMYPMVANVILKVNIFNCCRCFSIQLIMVIKVLNFHMTTGYNPVPQKVNCRRKCGNIDVPFPFGLEPGCSARPQFQLRCTNTTSSTLMFDRDHYLSQINIADGFLHIEHLKSNDFSLPAGRRDRDCLFSSIKSSDLALNWVVANLTCQEAQRNTSTYACVSDNSSCLSVNETGVDNSYRYIGYRCKCMNGYHGNPYELNGCHWVKRHIISPQMGESLLN